MRTPNLNRREFLAVSGAALAASAQRQCVVENDALRLSISLDRQTIARRSFENRLLSEVVSLPAEEFLLEFDDASEVSSNRLEVQLRQPDSGQAELLFSGPAGLEIRVRYTLSPQSAYLRKQISVRQRAGAARRLVRAQLENWQGVRRAWQSMRPDPLPYGSYPIFCDSLWAGVEFVAAFNKFGPDGFTLASRPGLIPIGPEWLDLNGTVIGVAPRGAVRDAFLRYIEDIRLAPARMVACYNSWWTLPKVVKQHDNLALIRELKAAMFDRHGIFFDIITTDMGWSNPRSIWEIDRSVLPQGFDDIRAIVEAAGGKLGLWMSPSELYPPVCDYDWAEKKGYVVLRPTSERLPGGRLASARPALSLADPKYRGQTKEQLKRLIRENGLGHIKYDGFCAVELRAHDGLAPGEDSVEPLAAFSLELLNASKEANPQLVTEPTYLNSIANYISPWIVKYSDTVWANAEDCVVGIGPAPDYRESHTNAREYMVFRSLDQVWLPQNALHYFDITHVDAKEGFPNHAAMAFGRGRFFVSTYLNPKLMNEEYWQIYAGLLRWARQNSGVLRNTVVVRSRVELGEPYLYAHWLGSRGILVVRNPSNESKTFLVDLAKSGAPENLANAVCYTQYPYRRGIAAGLDGRSQVPLALAPWEILFLEIVPRSELKEAIAVGARWYDSGEAMSIVPDRAKGSVRVLDPRSGERVIAVTPRKPEETKGELTSHAVRQLPEGEWLEAKSRTTAVFPFRYPAELEPRSIARLKESEWTNVTRRKVPSSAFEVECSVSIPEKEARGKALLLVEFPGREYRPSRCEAWIDGRAASLEQSSSDEHIGYYDWARGLAPYESEWCWYIVNLESGLHRVKFAGAAGHPNPRLGLWLWTECDLGEKAVSVPVRCSAASMPQYRERIERRGICLMQPPPRGPL